MMFWFYTYKFNSISTGQTASDLINASHKLNPLGSSGALQTIGLQINELTHFTSIFVNFFQNICVLFPYTHLILYTDS